MIVRGAGSLTVPGAGPPAYVSDWYYPLNSGVMDPGTTTLTTTDTRLYYIPFYVFQSVSIDLLAAYNSGVGDSGDDIRLGIYSHHASYGPRTLKVDFGEVSLTGAAAALVPTADETSLTRGWWWAAVHCNGAADMYAMRSRIASGYLLRGGQEFGLPALNSATLDDVNYFPYVDKTYAAMSSTATAPTTCTSIVPKLFFKVT